jgi:hypothetical protein
MSVYCNRCRRHADTLGCSCDWDPRPTLSQRIARFLKELLGR